MDLSTQTPPLPHGQNPPTEAHRALLAQRQQALAQAAAQLKAELFGIDDVIDRVVDAIRAWYALPQLITRPVIVCLWGLTGTGKTQQRIVATTDGGRTWHVQWSGPWTG